MARARTVSTTMMTPKAVAWAPKCFLRGELRWEQVVGTRACGHVGPQCLEVPLGQSPTAKSPAESLGCRWGAGYVNVTRMSEVLMPFFPHAVLIVL